MAGKRRGGRGMISWCGVEEGGLPPREQTEAAGALELEREIEIMGGRGHGGYEARRERNCLRAQRG